MVHQVNYWFRDISCRKGKSLVRFAPWSTSAPRYSFSLLVMVSEPIFLGIKVLGRRGTDRGGNEERRTGHGLDPYG